MTSKNDKDHLTNKVSIKAQLTKTGISVETSSRAVAAIDRLVGSIIYVPTVYMENLADTTRAKGKVAKDKILSTGLVGNNSEIEAKLMNLIADKQILQPFINKLHVIEKTIEELTSKAEKDENPGPDQEVDPDWLNYFDGHAEKASSETARARWAKVLTGEIRRPGSFSLRTLRFLAEVDQETAAVFADTVRLRFYKGSQILRPDQSNTGKTLEKLRLLEQEGLIDHTTPNNALFWTPGKPGPQGFVTVAEGYLCLGIYTKMKLEFDIIPLTRLGCEIATLLDPVDPMEVLEHLAKAVPRGIAPIKVFQIANYLQGNNLQISQTPIKILRPEKKEVS